MKFELKCFDSRVDDETRQREERISSLPVLQPRPVPRVSTATEAPSCKQKPPVKPRRSIKCRANPQPESGQSHGQDNQTENVASTTPSLLMNINSLHLNQALMRARMMTRFISYRLLAWHFFQSQLMKMFGVNNIEGGGNKSD